MKYYLNALKNYANTDGRASRKEYLIFMLINYIVVYALLYFSKCFEPRSVGSIMLIAASLFFICIIMCPTICLEIRRLHDVGKSGVWWWSRLVPILNVYFAYLTLLKPGQPFTNEYGPSPVQINNKSKIKESRNGKKQKRKKH